MPRTLSVYSGREILEGWKTVSVSRSLERLAGDFSIGLASIAPDDPAAEKLLRGSRVEVFLGEDLVLGGYVTRREQRYDGESNSITVSGKDVANDLVDCSATTEPGEWLGARVSSIAKRLLEPFDLIRFRDDLSPATLGSERKFSLNTGETVFAALDRIARSRGLVLASDLRGGVFFTQPGTTRAPIQLSRGLNIESGSRVDDEEERFSRYIAHGQAPTLDFWDTGAGPGMSYRAESFDLAVGRARPLVITAEKASSEADLRSRVAFESTVRAARGLQVTYTLPDWETDGHFWTPGELVSVYDPALGIGTSSGSPVDLLVGAVRWQATADGPSTTSLALFQPSAFTPAPPKAPPGTPGVEAWLP